MAGPSPLHIPPSYEQPQGIGCDAQAVRAGELEITGVNNEYIRQEAMGYSVLDGCLPRCGDVREFVKECCRIGWKVESKGIDIVKY